MVVETEPNPKLKKNVSPNVALLTIAPRPYRRRVEVAIKPNCSKLELKS